MITLLSVMILKNRRWLWVIAIPALIGVSIIFFFSTFETFYYQTREGTMIIYRVPLSARALIPAYILWTSSILLIIAMVPILYYFISRKVEEKLDKNMRIISRLVNKNNLASSEKQKKMDNREIILKFLNLKEKKVLEKLIEKKGAALQSEINLMEGMTKLKTHRAVKDLERKNIIKTETYGKTNRIILLEDIKKLMIK
jgi:hypothetical protein